ncbi:MAG TPA: asparagine synthase C-terminal domain-containing protein, partial [Gaiellaceae bacterium]|nr:asparagine synthase C-terminal domain-containing protein [Gaiellaceae bacterium]
REAGVVPHTVETSPQELRADLDRLIEIQGEPFGGTSIYAQYRVFQLARQAGIKVMLDGQGADELFAGYRYYLPDRFGGLLASGRFVTAARLLSALSDLPAASRAEVAVNGLQRVVPCASRTFLRGLAGRPPVPEWLDRRWLDARDVVLTDGARTDRANLKAHRVASVRGNLRTLLRHEDRNSMASSIESRVPFLTPALAEFAAGMPDDYLIAPDGTGKLVLKRSLRGLVPDPILDRRDKIGFATPEAKWLRTLAPWVEDVFDSDAARTVGPLRVDRARRCWQQMRDDRRPFNPVAWRWLNLIRWVDRFDVALD